jgi:hypothetical protein
MIASRDKAGFAVSTFVMLLFLGFVLIVQSNSAAGLARQVRRCNCAAALQRWATNLVARYETNVVGTTNDEIPATELPAALRSVRAPCSPWHARIERENGYGVVHLTSVGGFGGYGLTIGPPQMEMTTDKYCARVAPGFYAHRYP